MNKEFKKWEEENEEWLVEKYKEYLDDSTKEDSNFTIKNIENYWEWVQEEYTSYCERTI